MKSNDLNVWKMSMDGSNLVTLFWKDARDPLSQVTSVTLMADPTILGSLRSKKGRMFVFQPSEAGPTTGLNAESCRLETPTACVWMFWFGLMLMQTSV